MNCMLMGITVPSRRRTQSKSPHFFFFLSFFSLFQATYHVSETNRTTHEKRQSFLPSATKKQLRHVLPRLFHHRHITLHFVVVVVVVRVGWQCLRCPHPITVSVSTSLSGSMIPPPLFFRF